MSRPVRAVVLTLLIAGGTMAAVRLSRFMAVDACLDAGGRIGAQGTCEGVPVD